VDQLLPAVYHDVVMRRWHRPRLVFIGDAAHATSPQLGQGCNLALEDARVLAECLRDTGAVHEALPRYEAVRRRHVRYYQFVSRALTPFFQSDLRWLAPLRDLSLGLACRTPGIRSLLLSTLCGVRRGFLRPSLPIEPIRARLGAGEQRSEFHQ
jgi:2-polyprenyl-6-methoxyphenol hydroxylase-like FAD-dependent oxidoreductase